MSLLIFALIVLVVLALAIWAIDELALGSPRIRSLIKVLAIVIAAVVIIQRAGLV